MTSLNRYLVASCAFVALALSTAALGQDQSAKPATPTVDPAAKLVTDTMASTYKNLVTYHEKLHATVTASQEMMGDAPGDIEVRFQRPNKIWIQTTDKHAGRDVVTVFVSNGTALWRYNGLTNTYTREKAPATLAALSSLPGNTPEMEALIKGANPFETVAGASSPPTLASGTKIADQDADVVEVKLGGPADPLTGVIHASIGRKDHLIHAIEINGSGKNPTTGAPLTFSLSMSYDVIETAPKFTASDFTFTPPAGAKLISATGGSSAKPKSGK